MKEFKMNLLTKLPNNLPFLKNKVEWYETGEKQIRRTWWGRFQLEYEEACEVFDKKSGQTVKKSRWKLLTTKYDELMGWIAMSKK